MPVSVLFFATCFAFFAFFACLAPVFIGATLLSFSVLSVGATATWSAFPVLAVDGIVRPDVVLAAVSLLDAIVEPAGSRGMLFSDEAVELGVLDGDWLRDVESLPRFDDVDGVDDGAAVELDVVVVLGAPLFLLWLPRANADPLASAMIDVMTNIGASLRI